VLIAQGLFILRERLIVSFTSEGGNQK
jgi:hypothetical protein